MGSRCDFANPEHGGNFPYPEPGAVVPARPSTTSLTHLSTRSNVRERKAETAMATVEIGCRTTGTLTVDERDDRHLL